MHWYYAACTLPLLLKIFHPPYRHNAGSHCPTKLVPQTILLQRQMFLPRHYELVQFYSILQFNVWMLFPFVQIK